MSLRSTNTKTHYAISGDSLGITTLESACGKKASGYLSDEKYSDFKDEQLVFGDGGTMAMVNCHACLNSKEYREDLAKYHPDEEHPFVTRSKKAHATMREKRERHEARLNRLATEIASLPPKDRLRIASLLPKIEEVEA